MSDLHPNSSKTGKTYSVVSPVTGKTTRYRTGAKDRNNVYNVRGVDQDTRDTVNYLAAHYGSAASALTAAANLEFVRTKLRDYARHAPRTQYQVQEFARLRAEWDQALIVSPGGAK